MSAPGKSVGVTLPEVPPGGFGLYVHWPFCLSKCPYCDFNSHVAGEIDGARWRRALVADLAAAAEATGTGGRALGSIFFGGGTPSLMPPETVAAVLDAAAALWPPAAGAEVTLEANPTSVEAARLAGYRAAGVNRISLGIQSLDDNDLRRLGRLHTVAEAVAALDTAGRLFARVSFDLIYARQDQTPAAWRAELGRALDLARDHLSLYQLTIEEGTRFGDLYARGGLRGLPDSALGAELWEITGEFCEAAGLPAYEVSNHARPGAESQHNLVYWRGGDWIGIGPGAHGRVTRSGRRLASERPRDPAAWLHQVESGRAATVALDPLAPTEAADEYLMMALRLAEGAETDRHTAMGGAPLGPGRIAALTAEGFLWQQGGRIGTTRRGRPLLDAVLRRLLT